MNSLNAASAPVPVRSFGLRAGTVALCMVAMTGCSTVSGWFSKDKEKPNEPTKLVEFAPSVNVSKLWSTGVGGGEGRLGARQGPVVADGRVYAAAVKGGVSALDLQSGKSVWHYDSKLALSGGPGAGDGLVVVGGLEGDVVALDAATGAEKWKAKVTNEVIAAPVVGLGMVFVRSNDGRLTAFDAASGERRWFWNHDVPPLSVRGNDAPALGPGYVFLGNDDGTVVALASTDGHPLWELPAGEAEGRTELDRMADSDGTPLLDGATLFVSSFKGRTVSIDAPNGRGNWASEHGGAGRVANASDRVVVSSRDGTVYALDKASGGAMWQQPALLRRDPTSPVVQGDYAVVGDFDGYLHWMKLSDGALAARLRASRDALRGAPVVSDGVLVVQSIDGDVSAYRLAQ